MSSPATETGLQPRAFFTAPWEPVAARRGDALGLRALADQFADALAPDLSNRVTDGRWVTILAWCLTRSHEVFHASGARSMETREQQRARYAWLRPLELMWVARTIAIAEDWGKRPLSGRRRVRRWYEDDKQKKDRFGMTEDQFRAYRQTGAYGGYRVAFRAWPGLTRGGDGWTPDKASIDLAKWMEGKLGPARPSWPLHIDDGLKDHCPTPNKRSLGKEHDWWLRQWPTFAEQGKSVEENTLPRRRDDFAILPEANLLEPLVFAGGERGKRRLEMARETERAQATDHLGICEHLAGAFADDSTINFLPSFSRLADAGMEAMDLVAEALRRDEKESRVALADLAALPAARDVCEKLADAAGDWRKSATMQVPHVETAHRFANAIQRPRPIECLSALLRHHEEQGGGLRWFVLRDGKVEPRSPLRDGIMRYRFRLWSLCRLATQCGVLRKMPEALTKGAETEEDEALESTEAADE